jgi:hypothetical protein
MRYTRLITAAGVCVCVYTHIFSGKTITLIIIRRAFHCVRDRKAGGARVQLYAATVDAGKTMGPKKYTSPTNRYVFQRCGAYPAAISRFERVYICVCVLRSGIAVVCIGAVCVRQRDQTILRRNRGPRSAFTDIAATCACVRWHCRRAPMSRARCASVHNRYHTAYNIYILYYSTIIVCSACTRD